MKVLITGADGQLGYDVKGLFSARGIEAIGTDRDMLDFSVKAQVEEILTDIEPDVVIHCGAYTAVDMAETDRDTAYAVNVKGTSYLAQWCEQYTAKLVYISTDYVYDGTKTEPYIESDAVNPLNYYGQTKYEGELAVTESLEDYIIIRTSWVFGAHGNNFVKTMLQLGEKLDKIMVVDDQWGSPTYTQDLAQLIYQLVMNDETGLFHGHNEGYCTWHDFATAIMKVGDLQCTVHPTTTEAYNSKLTKVVAPRPMNNCLSTDKLGDWKLPAWQDALERYMAELRTDKIVES